MTIFYEKLISEGVKKLSEEESKHCSQVLRKKIGDEILVFDGIGNKYKCVLTQVSKKTCAFDIVSTHETSQKPFSIHLAIAPTKNTDRIEWLVEKLCEIGVDRISFIRTKHSERKNLRIDRLERKVISAMKQSGNPYLMKVNELISFDDLLRDVSEEERFIAHVDSSHEYLSKIAHHKKTTIILIGPEGDFSSEEVEKAKIRGFRPVSLGENTLRTETAGFVACCMINTLNDY